MTKRLLKLGTSLLAVGGALIYLDDGAGTPPPLDPNGLQLVTAYYPLQTSPYTNLARDANPFGAVSKSGGGWYRTQDLYEDGHIDASDGTVLSFPGDVTGWSSTEITSYGFAENPSYYTGKTLVVECIQGKFKGSGNSIGLFQPGAVFSSTYTNLEQEYTASAAQTQFTFTGAAGWTASQIHVYVDGYRQEHKKVAGTDYTVADSGGNLLVTFATPMTGGENVFILINRHEYVLDPANWGTSPPREAGIFVSAPVGTVGAISNLLPPVVYFKDEEANFRASFTNPLYVLANWLREYYSYANGTRVFRTMDTLDPQRNFGTVPADHGGVKPWAVASRGNHLADFDYTFGGGMGVPQSWPNREVLAFCKDQGIIPWLDMPSCTGMPHAPGFELDKIQTGANTARLYLKETVVDLAQPVSLSNPSLANVATLNLAKRRIDYDFTPMSHAGSGVEADFSVTLNFTDVKGIPRSYIIRHPVSSWDPHDGNSFLPFPNWKYLWLDNTDYFLNHWAWNDYADFFIDDLVAVNWPTSSPVYFEHGNEQWNTAQPFLAQTTYSHGAGMQFASDYVNSGNLCGNGWLAARFDKAIQDRLTARGLSFDIRPISGAWTAINWSSTARLFGFNRFWSSANGGSLSGPALQAKLDRLKIALTNYYSGALSSNASWNYTGLPDYQEFSGTGAQTQYTMTGAAGVAQNDVVAYVAGVQQTPGTDFTVADSGSNLIVTFAVAPAFEAYIIINTGVHANKVIQDWTADENAFWMTTVYNWYTGAARPYNQGWVVDLYDQHIANVEAYGLDATNIVFYEGGSHDNDAGGNISGRLVSNPAFMASYDTYMNGVLGAALWNDMANKIIARNPDSWIAVYGGPYKWFVGQPWAYGQHEKPKNGYATAIFNTSQ